MKICNTPDSTVHKYHELNGLMRYIAGMFSIFNAQIPSIACEIPTPIIVLWRAYIQPHSIPAKNEMNANCIDQVM